MDNRYQTVVEGEASESEEEELPSPPQPEMRAIVVEGEASESEEEELDTSGRSIPRLTTSLKKSSEHGSSYESIDDMGNIASSGSRHIWKPKYDTILNRKLWESNLSFCNNINGMASQAYVSAAKDITNCVHQLSKSHAAIQDVSHNMRLLTNDLFNLDDHVDIVISCKLLPDITLPSPKADSPQTPDSNKTSQQGQ